MDKTHTTILGNRNNIFNAAVLPIRMSGAKNQTKKNRNLGNTKIQSHFLYAHKNPEAQCLHSFVKLANIPCPQKHKSGQNRIEQREKTGDKLD